MAPTARESAPRREEARAPKARNEVADPADLNEFFAEPEAAPGYASEKEDTLDGEPDRLVELLVFRLGPEDYALPVPLLREIVMPPPLSEVPRADKSVLGVTMLRGEVVPVLDPRPLLRLAPRGATSPATRVIIVDAGEGPLGLWVDGVVQVVRTPASALEVPPAGLAGENEAIAHLGRRGERLFGVLNLGQLLAGRERR